MDVKTLQKYLLRDGLHFNEELALADHWFKLLPHEQGVAYRRMIWQTYDYHLTARRLGQIYQEVMTALVAVNSTNKATRRRRFTEREMKLLGEVVRYARDRHIRTSSAPLWFQHDPRNNKIPPRYTEYDEYVKACERRIADGLYEV